MRRRSALVADYQSAALEFKWRGAPSYVINLSLENPPRIMDLRNQIPGESALFNKLKKRCKISSSSIGVLAICSSRLLARNQWTDNGRDVIIPDLLRESLRRSY